MTLVLSALVLSPCGASDASLEKAQPPLYQSLLIQGLADAITETPYSALVQQMTVDVIALPDIDKNDDYAEEQHIYNAAVLETYRGPQLKNISYAVIVEKGKAAMLSKEPVILTLCEKEDIFFWPGVSSTFPASNQVKSIAKAVSKNVDAKQASFANCD